MSSLQCSPPTLQQKQQNIHHVQSQNPEMFHWTSGPRHQMTSNNWQINNCQPSGHPYPHPHQNQSVGGEVPFYDSSMQLKVPRQGMEYSRMISPVNQNALNSGGYYMAGSVRGQQGMVQGASMVNDVRGVPYNSQMSPMNGYMGNPMNGRSMMTSPMMSSGEMMMEKGGSTCDLKMTKMNSYTHHRVSPYANPQQYMQNKRAQYNNTQQQQQINYKGNQPRNPLTPMWTNNSSPWPRQAPLSPNSYPPNVRQYPPNCPPQHLPSSHSPIRGHFLNGAPRSYEMLPFPGNPTPPTTPGAGGGPPFYPSPEAESRMMRYRDTEPRLCFPIRDGQIMEPFRLEHNLTVTTHMFILREHVYQSLMSRPDLELQLKCYHNDDRMMMTNWPTSLNITLNSVPLAIDRGDDVTPHQPLLLKSYCKVEGNMLQIAVSACCCSHLFVVQIVHRPPVRSVLENLITKRLLPAEHGVTKIKRAVAGNEGATIKLSLICPISKNKINLPARGLDCQHIQCFDLESYLKTNCELNSWICPICKKLAILENLEIDQYIWAILKYVAGTRFDEVVTDSKGNWKPTAYNEVTDADNMSLKRGMTLETMHMPSINTWLNQQSPYQNPAPSCLTPASSSSSSSSSSFRNKEQDHVTMQQGKYLGGNGPSQGSSTTDYLGCLSQLSNSILSDDSRNTYGNNNGGNNGNSNNNGGTSHPDHLSFPPTPMGSQMSNICTPLDGQSLHPRTPSDGIPHTSPEALLHPQTPNECLLPKTPLDGGTNPCSNSISNNFNNVNIANSSNLLDPKKGKPKTSTPSMASYSMSPSKVEANPQPQGESSIKTEDIDFSFDLNLESISSQSDMKDNTSYDTSISTGNLTLPETFDDDLSLYLGPKGESTTPNADDLLQFL